ncbi:MAG: DTW domain-containing protein [Proteobacteria bacterium]|nr:MAG: DTW domain-containing protein [Pseudomonadota bacterium]
MNDAREVCYVCRKAQVMCYCQGVKPFASNPRFVILIHPKETKKAINTGRMAFRCLSNALLLVGDRFDDDLTLRSILSSDTNRCFVLFPGENATDVSAVNDCGKQDVFIVLDATWSMARKMYRDSECLKALPQVMFTPPKVSGFLIRQQPGMHCYSTLETIHHIIETRQPPPLGEHHQMLTLFNEMVTQQITYEIENQNAF